MECWIREPGGQIALFQAGNGPFGPLLGPVRPGETPEQAAVRALAAVSIMDCDDDRCFAFAGGLTAADLTLVAPGVWLVWAPSAQLMVLPPGDCNGLRWLRPDDVAEALPPGGSRRTWALVRAWQLSSA